MPGFLALTLIAALATPTPKPSPTPAVPVIANVTVATGSAQSLHELPVAAAVLDAPAIALSPAYTTNSLLRQLPGFDPARSNSLFTNYGQLRVSFAGSGNDRGLVFVDGIPANDGFGGQVDWAAYPVSDLNRAELLLGPGSALYGSGAIAGVLDLQSKVQPAPDAPPSGHATFAAGTQYYVQDDASLAAPIQSKLSASAMVSQQSLAYWALPPQYQSANSQISQGNATAAVARLGYTPGEHDSLGLSVRGAWDSQFEGRPNYTFSRRFAQTDLQYKHSTTRSSLGAIVYSRITFIVNDADRFPKAPGVPLYVQNVPTSENGEFLTWNISGGNSTFQLRAAAQHVGGEALQFAAAGTVQSANAGMQNINGLALQETWQPDRFEAVAGANVTTVHSYGSGLNGNAGVVSPRLALRYNLTPQLVLRASSGAGMRAPYLNELLRSYVIAGVTYLANPSLVPERSHTESAGLDLLQGRSRLSFDAFDTAVNDAIMFHTIDPTKQMRSNIAQTGSQSYVLSYTLGITPSSRLSAWITDQNARVGSGPADIVGKQLAYVPAQTASIGYDALFRGMDAGITVSYLGQAYADDLNTEPLGTAVVLGARVRIPVMSGAALEIAADNASGALYRSSIDRYGPPAVVSVGLDVGR